MIRTRDLALLACLALLPSGALAQEPAPEDASAFTIGDKLRVTFFEEMDLPAAPGGGAPATTFYQRVDLTSDYVVGADGRISLPRLGPVAVAGRSADEVHDEIQDAYEAAMGRSGDVHVAILERQPVYVLGPVRAPGAFPFASGMVAIQAIALAGGPERAQDRIAPVVEAGREAERSEDARTRLTLLLSRRAWLEAERTDTAPAVPEELARLVGETGAREMVEAEAQAGAAAAAARRREIAGLAERAAAWRDEIAVQRRALADFERETALREARIREATEPDPRLSRDTVIAAQRAELVDLEARRQQAQSAIHRIEQQIAETQAARARISLEFERTVAQDLVTLTNDIARLRQTAGSASEIAGSLAEGAAPRGAEDFAITIVRTTAADGVRTLDATPVTRLMPGDVVRVGPAGEAGRSAALDAAGGAVR